ncbi:hypothetical protein AltI4_16230 [Alteromonas sp. I4]|nr:hypothetical protein AltI4_16230 [Alteromonas sp. I4]
MTLSFEWESTRQIRAIHIGPKGSLIYSEAGNENLRAIRFEVWCFHLSITDPSLSFPVSGSTVTCSQLRTNGLFLLAIVNNAFTLKLNIATEPAEGPTIAEFRAGLSIAHPEASRAPATEIEILLDWLISAHTEVKTPLPGLTAIDIVSDAIYQYLVLPNRMENRKACSRLKSLINKFMDYDLTAQGYVNALIALKKTAVAY